MLESIIMYKLIEMAKWFNLIGWVVSVSIFIWVLGRGIRDTGYCEEHWIIDYYNISQREDKFINLTILFCVLQTIILFNPLTISGFPVTQSIYNAFEGMYGYLVMFSINHIPYRIFSIPMLLILLLHYKAILSNNTKSSYYDYSKFPITRSKFINTAVIIILALVLQITLYLLIPSNDFIIHNIAGIEEM